MSYRPAPPAGKEDMPSYVHRELTRLSNAYADNAPKVLFRTQPANAGTLSAGLSANWKVVAGNVVRLSASATLTLTGLALKEPHRELVLTNVGTAAVVLLSESSASSASYRFALPETWQLSANASAVLWYDPISSRWRGLSRT